MILIKAPDETVADAITADFESISDFPHCDFADLNNLALSEINIDYMDWMVGDPLVFDESGGLSIEEWKPEALTWFLENTQILKEFGIDPITFETFATGNSNHRLFSVDTF